MITVIVPTYQGAARIATCLDDLAAQTLDPALFEVVVVQNGPPTETPRIVAEWCERHPEHTVRLIETDVASAQNARNIVLDGETREWVAFVDDDDRLQPRYLDALWDAAAPGLVPYGRVGIVVEGQLDRIDEGSWLSTVPRQHLGRPRDAVTNADLWPAINPAWGKIAERSVIGDVRFDTSLRYADDTVFWMEVLARSGARLTLTDQRDDSAYLWVQRAGSITRSGTDPWTTYVVQKLDAIAALQRVTAGAADPTREACASVSALFWGTVVDAVRHDRGWLPRVHEEIAARDLVDVPWQLLHEGAASELILARGPLAGPPDGPVVDLVTYGTAARAFTEDEAAWLTRRLDRHVGVTGPSDCDWSLVGAVLEHLREALPKLGGEQRYAAVRSVSDGALEHLLAAMVKLIDPSVSWSATLTGGAAERPGAGIAAEDDWVLAVLVGGLAEAGVPLDAVPDMWGLARLLAGSLADELVDESTDGPVAGPAGGPAAAPREEPVAGPSATPAAAPTAAPTDRPGAASEGGSTIAYVSSPLQSLNLVEYCSATGEVPDLVIVGAADHNGNRLQTLAPLEGLVEAGVPVHLQQYTGGWVTLDASAPRAIQELDSVLLPYAPIRRFVVGDYHRPALWTMLNALGIQGESLVVVDDGTGTLTIDRPGQLAERTAPAAGADPRPPARLTFFTAYADDIRVGPHDTVIRNGRDVLRSRYRDVTLDDNLVFVVGSPLLEHGVVTSGDVELALELVEEARRWSPGAAVAYVAHRWERPEKLQAIQSVCEVLLFDLPFELIPVQVGSLAHRFVGHFSSLLGNLADLTDGRVEIRSYRVPPALVAPDRRDAVVRATETAAREHPGAITVLEYASLAESV